MTRKRYDEPLFRQWFIELDAALRHDILCYLVEVRVLNEGDFFWDGLPFLSILEEQINAASIYLDKLSEAKDDIELAELEGTVGSLIGQHQTERFLDEKDFLLQVIEKSSYKELSIQAQTALTNKYPLAIRTVEYLMRKINEPPLPSCLWSPKLNEDFSISNLWNSNKLEEVLLFHTNLIKKPSSTSKSPEQFYKSKPDLITSNKKYQYIDISLTEHKGGAVFSLLSYFTATEY